MKIAVVASPVTPLRPAQLGGAQAFVCDLARGLTQRGHDLILYCAEGSAVPGVTIATVPLPRDAPAALVMPGGAQPAPAPGLAYSLGAVFAAIPRDVDAVSQHAFDAPALALGRGLPILHTLHLPPIVDAVVRAAAELPPSRLATVSRASWRAWAAAGVEVGEVLPNGVPDVPVGTPDVDPVVLVAGRISPEKGIEDALAAAREVGMGVRLAGAHYDPAYAPDLAGVETLGALPRDELRRVMAASAVTVCAVRWDEPFGLVAAEAQMAGCPVAAYRRGAMEEVVEDGEGGRLARPGDTTDLARAIRECLALDRASVQASAQRRLGLEAALDRYESALQRLAS